MRKQLQSIHNWFWPKRLQKNRQQILSFGNNSRYHKLHAKQRFRIIKVGYGLRSRSLWTEGYGLKGYGLKPMD